jgi:hypothetical protein
VAGPLVPAQMEAGTKGSRPKALFLLVFLAIFRYYLLIYKQLLHRCLLLLPGVFFFIGAFFFALVLSFAGVFFMGVTFFTGVLFLQMHVEQYYWSNLSQYSFATTRIKTIEYPK